MSQVLATAGPDETLVRGEGSWLVDAAGRRFLDARAGIANVQLGYSRRDVTDAMHRQAETLPFTSTFRHDRPARVIVDYADELTRAAPAGLTRVRFTHTGSAAVEAAVHMARLYHRNHERPDKQVVVGLQGAFHGSTAIGMAVSGIPMLHQIFGPMPAGFHHAAAPDPSSCPACRDDELGSGGPTCADRFAQELDEVGADQIAAVVLSPMIGLGTPLPTHYVRAVREYCDRNDILLVLDEVTTGFGRFGPMFSSTEFGVAPDILCLAKAITAGYAALGAVVVSEAVYQAFDQPGKPFFYHGSSTDAHPISCAAGLAVLHAYQAEGVVEQGQAMARRLHAKLSEALADNPNVGAVRAKGALFVLDLVSPDGSPAPQPAVAEVQARCAAQGLFVDHNIFVIGLVPPLNFTEDEEDLTVDVLDKVLREIDVREASMR
ncbi:aspartate aminotransferase family protein [Micromonospora zingiberis]|nr:aminotransferase class III-fold pyridoxal phosphate-dependent enzyme [Micromonospora zingiberis]